MADKTGFEPFEENRRISSKVLASFVCSQFPF